MIGLSRLDAWPEDYEWPSLKETNEGDNYDNIETE